MQRARVKAVCVSEAKGTVKREVPGAMLRTGWGIEGDAHAGPWRRQVSLLADESIRGVMEHLPGLVPGAFAENIVTCGLDAARVEVGDQVCVGDEAVLEVTQIGKVCHNDGCAIKQATGDCIMPRVGLFARVVRGGRVEAGDRMVLRSKSRAVPAEDGQGPGT